MDHTGIMTDVLSLARADLERLEAELKDLNDAIRMKEMAFAEQVAFVVKLEGYHGIRRDVPLPKRGRRIRITRRPREGTTRWKIADQAKHIILRDGPTPTSELVEQIPTDLFSGSENPKNYLSNVLSKDGRFEPTARGWELRDEALEPGTEVAKFDPA